MSLYIYDYGAQYEYEHYDVTFSHWGYLEVTLEGTIEDLPWSHADSVRAELELHGTTYEFEATVSVPEQSCEPGFHHGIVVHLFATEYETK